MKLEDIHLNYHTDKGTTHSYIPIYDQLFASRQHDSFNFLEVGALTCGSLRMFHEFFTQAQIMGMDNWSQTCDHTGVPFAVNGTNLVEIIQQVSRTCPRINLITCDSSNAEQVNQKLQGLKFEIIIDDGDHDPHAQLKTFQNLYEYWHAHSGIYVVEDVINLNYSVQAFQHVIDQQAWPVLVQPHALCKMNRQDDNLIVLTHKH